MNFSDKICDWYSTNKRDLPWRHTKDPYLIWLSEIILQQTRVDQGMSYYLKFTEHFPTVEKLANADNDKVMKLWQGLGYYSRARNLHASAQTITNELGGAFPTEFKDILKLKGVGEYTASAIASFAYNKAHAVIDGNVYRVLSRAFGIATPIDSTEGKKEFSKLANELIDPKNPAMHNQAIMELGALVCKPANPTCENCPLSRSCFAYANKEINSLPIKAKKIKVRNRYFNYIVLNYKGETVIKQRKEKDIWTNLYDFPCIETDKELSEADFLSSKEWKGFIQKEEYTISNISTPSKHILSHQRIYARFWEINCKHPLNELLNKNFLTIKRDTIQEYAIPRLIDKYLNI